MASIITKMKLQNIEKTKKKRKKRKNKTDTIKLIRKKRQCAAKLQPERGPCNQKTKMQRPLPWSEHRWTLCKQNIMEINTCTCINKKKRRETNLMKCNN